MEREGGLTEQNAKFIQNQIKKTETIRFLPHSLTRLFDRSESITLEEISNSIASFMDLESAEKYYFIYGFNLRISRLSHLNLRKHARSLFTLHNPSEIPDDPILIEQYQKADGLIQKHIEACTTYVKNKKYIVENDMLHKKLDSTQTLEEIQMIRNRLEELDNEVNLSLDSSNSVESWLRQAADSGKLLAINFYNTDSDPASLVEASQEQNRRIIETRNKIPKEKKRFGK